MSHLRNPTLFSTYFNISAGHLLDAGLIDPFVGVDMPLFIDPVLLEKSSNKVISETATERFHRHFESFVRLLAISANENDAAWKAARRQLNLDEPPGNGLGYGGSERSGSSRPESIREAILRTSKEIITLGATDPEMISLMGFFEENVGPDTISDLTTTVIIDDLATITHNFCTRHGVAVERFEIGAGHGLPKFTDSKGRAKPIFLVPRDIVRELPIANDWSDIERAAMENSRIRERVNRLLAGITKPTIADRKAALRHAALASSDDFQFFLASVKENVSAYDPNLDALGYYLIKDIFKTGFPDLRQATTYDLQLGPEEIRRVALDSIELFRRHVEDGNLWEELWVEGKPKKERAAQLIYYAIADAFCKANGVDISPEANMGGGPIDFKFSNGYHARVLVEMKRSMGTVVHGYEKQLEICKSASQTEWGVFVVIDFGDLDQKLDEIVSIKNDRIKGGKRASDIIVVDATPKTSASKRK